MVEPLLLNPNSPHPSSPPFSGWSSRTSSTAAKASSFSPSPSRASWRDGLTSDRPQHEPAESPPPLLLCECVLCAWTKVQSAVTLQWLFVKLLLCVSYSVVLVKGFSSAHVPACTHTGVSIAGAQYPHCSQRSVCSPRSNNISSANIYTTEPLLSNPVKLHHSLDRAGFLRVVKYF